MIFYISGPITGIANFRIKFDEAQLKLMKQGHKVFNPAYMPDGLTYKEYMPICYSMIDASTAVYFLKDWQKSKGARLEFDYATKHGKNLSFEEEISHGKTNSTNKK